tara:strand:+ start:651 stop:3086 length:2436 start_codon:yes stop_codon:yes gene_type:complete
MAVTKDPYPESRNVSGPKLNKNAYIAMLALKDYGYPGTYAVTSMHRTEEVNKKHKGKKHSLHLKGNALDIGNKTKEEKELIEWIETEAGQKWLKDFNIYDEDEGDHHHFGFKDVKDTSLITNYSKYEKAYTTNKNDDDEYVSVNVEKGDLDWDNVSSKIPDIQVALITPETTDPITGEVEQKETTGEFTEYGDYSTRVYDSKTEKQYLVSVDFEEDEFGNVTQKVRVFDNEGKEITDTNKELVNDLTVEVIDGALSGENKFQKEGDVFYSTKTGDLDEDRGRFAVYDQPLVTYGKTKQTKHQIPEGKKLTKVLNERGESVDFSGKTKNPLGNYTFVYDDGTKDDVFINAHGTRFDQITDKFTVKKDIPENKKESINKLVVEKTKERLRKEKQQEKESIEKLRKEAEIDTPGREHLSKLNKELEALQKRQSTYAPGTPSHNKLQAQIDKKQKEVDKFNADVLKTEHEEKLALAVGEEKSARERLAKIQRDLEDDPNSHTQAEVDAAKVNIDRTVKKVYELTDNPSTELPFDSSDEAIEESQKKADEIEVEDKTAIIKEAEEGEDQEVVVQPEVTVTDDKDEDEDGEKREGWFKGIGGVSTLVSGVLGGIGLAQALKNPDPKDMPKLSEAFEEHLKQSKQLADQGFSPMEEAKIRRDIDGAYKTGMDNIVRGSAGDRAKFLAMSGVLDVNRSTALLDFAAKDAQAAREGRKEYGELLQYKENFEAQKSLALRTEDLQMQLESKKAGAELAKGAFAEIMDNVNSSRLNNLREVYMQKLIDDMSPVSEVEKGLDITSTGSNTSSLVWNEETKEWE